MSKTITCSDTVPQGGCGVKITADSADDAKEQLKAHAGEAHADMMAKSTETDVESWNKNFDENVWPNTPED